MESDRRALLNQILEYHFACIELNLSVVLVNL